MAKNFELIFPCEMAISMADHTLKLWTREDIVKVVESHNCKWIIAQHPEDTGESPNSCKFKHWHCGVHTSSDNTYETIAKWFGVPVNSVQSIKSKFDSTYALYLKHYNATYDDGTPKPSIAKEDIVTNFNLDYDKLVGRVEVSTAKDDILVKIANGEIKKYQFPDLLTDAFRIRYAKQISTALGIWNEKKMRGERDMAKDVIWIYGKAGLGKTELAKYIAKSSFGEYDYFLSDSGSNPFDNYGDQPCIILDDVGSDNLNSKVVLKLFDPYNKCFTKARYFNRAIDADLIIVTSSISPEVFWSKCRDEYDVSGDWEQLLRRLTGGIYHFLDSETMEFTMFDNTGANPFTAKVNVPADVQNHTVTVSAETRAKNALGKFNMTFSLDDDNTLSMSGNFKQLELDDTPWAPHATDVRDGKPKRKKA